MHECALLSICLASHSDSGPVQWLYLAVGAGAPLADLAVVFLFIYFSLSVFFPPPSVSHLFSYFIFIIRAAVYYAVLFRHLLNLISWQMNCYLHRKRYDVIIYLTSETLLTKVAVLTFSKNTLQPFLSASGRLHLGTVFISMFTMTFKICLSDVMFTMFTGFVYSFSKN